jgi:hypothetical protein
MAFLRLMGWLKQVAEGAATQWTNPWWLTFLTFSVVLLPLHYEARRGFEPDAESWPSLFDSPLTALLYTADQLAMPFFPLLVGAIWLGGVDIEVKPATRRFLNACLLIGGLVYAAAAQYWAHKQLNAVFGVPASNFSIAPTVIAASYGPMMLFAPIISYGKTISDISWKLAAAAALLWVFMALRPRLRGRFPLSLLAKVGLSMACVNLFTTSITARYVTLPLAVQAAAMVDFTDKHYCNGYPAVAPGGGSPSLLFLGDNLVLGLTPLEYQYWNHLTNLKTNPDALENLRKLEPSLKSGLRWPVLISKCLLGEGEEMEVVYREAWRIVPVGRTEEIRVMVDVPLPKPSAKSLFKEPRPSVLPALPHEEFMLNRVPRLPGPRVEQPLEFRYRPAPSDISPLPSRPSM